MSATARTGAKAPFGSRPVRPVRPVHSALALLGLAGAAIGGTLMAMFAAGPATLRVPMTLYVTVGLEYWTAGLIAWTRRPSNGTGALLCLCGLSLFAAASGNTAIPALVTAGNLVAELPLAVVFHLLLAFPSGQLPDRFSRRLVLAGYLISVVLPTVRLALAGDPALPRIPGVSGHAGLAAVALWSQVPAGAVVIALAVRLLAHRLRRATGSARRQLALVYCYGGGAFVFVILSADLLRPALDLDPLLVFDMQILALAGIPAAFLAGVLGGGFPRTGALEELAAWLATADHDRPTLREALRATLGDPTLDLLFWLGERQQYVDEDGHPVPLPAPGSGRAAVEVSTATGLVGAVTYDATLLGHQDAVEAAGRVVALAVERERLTAQLRASREALRASRSRLVESSDRERRRITRDLHDGLQGRLVVLALRAGQIAARIGATHPLAPELVALRTDLESAITDLRRLVHGVLPALLIDRGLPATIEELLDHTPLRSRLVVAVEGRLPPHVETAGYFVIAEALANAVKHGKARQVAVTLTGAGSTLRIEVRDDGVGGASLQSGSGLRGLSDRVEALGGRLDLDSRPGRGTCLLAEVPCAS